MGRHVPLHLVFPVLSLLVPAAAMPADSGAPVSGGAASIATELPLGMSIEAVLRDGHVVRGTLKNHTYLSRAEYAARFAARRDSVPGLQVMPAPDTPVVIETNAGERLSSRFLGFSVSGLYVAPPEREGMRHIAYRDLRSLQPEGRDPLGSAQIEMLHANNVLPLVDALMITVESELTTVAVDDIARLERVTPAHSRTGKAILGIAVGLTMLGALLAYGMSGNWD